MRSSPKKLRILMLISQYWPYVGGAERQAERLAGELVRRGHMVEILTKPHPERPAIEERDGICIRRELRTLPVGKIWGISYLVSAFWHLYKRKDQFDIFHLHQLYLHAASATMVRRLGGPPVVVKMVNSGVFADWLLLQKMTGGALWLKWAKRVDRALAICRRLEPEMQCAGFSPQQIARIPNGVDAEKFHPMPDIQPVLGRILYLGRLDPYKGLFTLLDAMDLLRKKHPESPKPQIHIVGEGPLYDSLRNEINKRALNDLVVLRPPVEDVLPEYAQASVLALPSTAEGMSNVMLEAMACGRPVVAARVGGADDLLEGPYGVDLPELADDAYFIGKSGILVEPECPTALAAALERVLKDEDLARQLSGNARKTVRESFSMQAIVDQYEALYEDLIEADTRKASVVPPSGGKPNRVRRR